MICAGDWTSQCDAGELSLGGRTVGQSGFDFVKQPYLSKARDSRIIVRLFAFLKGLKQRKTKGQPVQRKGDYVVYLPDSFQDEEGLWFFVQCYCASTGAYRNGCLAVVPVE
jgi:hypothetical protein